MTQKIKQDDARLKPDNDYKKIVVLDDDRDITTTFRTILESDLISKDNAALRFKIHTSNSPEQFLAEFEPGLYDLLLIDINMPGMDGFETGRRLLEMDLNLRICFITADEINYRAMREVHVVCNVGSFITKPISAKDPINKVRIELE